MPDSVTLAGLQSLMLAELRVPNHSPAALEDLRGRAANIRQVSGHFRFNAFVGRVSAFARW